MQARAAIRLQARRGEDQAFLLLVREGWDIALHDASRGTDVQRIAGEAGHNAGKSVQSVP